MRVINPSFNIITVQLEPQQSFDVSALIPDVDAVASLHDVALLDIESFA